MKYREWRVAPDHPQVSEALEEEGVPPLLARILAARGVADAEEGLRILNPREEPLWDPMLLRDMDRAVARLALARERDELVAVYGDYDVDGITSTCLLTEYLTDAGYRVIPYIPSRLDEGYGLNREAITSLAGQGVTLIITVDCGITAVEEVAFAAGLRVDVVVTDHHACKEELPDAAAVVDPHRPDCPYPFKGLAGVGVALKLALADAGPGGKERVLEEFCDLAAVGTVADVMPMEGENRAIVSLGLEKLNPPRRTGLAALIREAGMGDRAINTVSVGYTLAPRINASGRLGRAEVAAELLLCRDPGRAEELAKELCALNWERQSIESEIFTQCVQRLEQEPQKGAIVLADSRWHQGVVGIVASRLAERYGCPAFMICLDGGIGKGSCRSWAGINLFRLLTDCTPLLESFGGHALAAGFTVREENILALAEALRRGILDQEGEELPSVLEADAAVTPPALTVEAVEALELLEPCGAGNPRPVLVLTGAQVQSMAQVGRGRHLKMRVESRGSLLDAIYFSADGAELGLTPGCRVDIAFCPQINEFRGNRTVQLQVVDLRAAPSRAQLEQEIYERFSRGGDLTPEEARFLLPERREFANLWRWLERQADAGAEIEDTLSRIVRGSAGHRGRREAPARVLVCLRVFEERGLIRMQEQADRYRITLCRTEQKVDLESSGLMIRLREVLEKSGS